jgi:hypothetical protein
MVFSLPALKYFLIAVRLSLLNSGFLSQDMYLADYFSCFSSYKSIAESLFFVQPLQGRSNLLLTWVFRLRSSNSVEGQRSTVFQHPSSVFRLPTSVDGQRSTVNGQRSTVFRLRTSVFRLPSPTSGLQPPNSQPIIAFDGNDGPAMLKGKPWKKLIKLERHNLKALNSLMVLKIKFCWNVTNLYS